MDIVTIDTVWHEMNGIQSVKRAWAAFNFDLLFVLWFFHLWWVLQLSDEFLTKKKKIKQNHNEQYKEIVKRKPKQKFQPKKLIESFVWLNNMHTKQKRVHFLVGFPLAVLDCLATTDVLFPVWCNGTLKWCECVLIFFLQWMSFTLLTLKLITNGCHHRN